MAKTSPDADDSGSWSDTFYSLNRGDVNSEIERLVYNHFNVWLPLTRQVVPTHILEQLPY
ncbi:hypothetical protein F5883DRAFT_433408 [Diaporthe sp. PMI_573]|nr:hypothetical protein F5883DRAFT_433408 [Diaporthaceae sp. PMI_573]